MANPKVVQEWLDSADEDLLFAKESLAAYDGFYAKICFHFQQAAEKYLKTFLISNNEPLTKIHDLLQLLKLCVKKDQSLINLSDDAKFLTDFYIVTRYPVSWPIGITEQDAQKAQESTEHIATEIKNRISI